jgi:hypothetical protein
MLRTLLKGRDLSQFEYHLRKLLGAEDIELPDHDLLKLVIRDVRLEYISRHAIRVQKYYMRRSLFMQLSVSVQQFVEHLNEMNCYLLYFPREFLTQLDQDGIIEIPDQSKSPEWHAAMTLANIDIFEMNYEEAISCFKRLKNLEKIRLTNGPAPNTTTVDNKKSVTSSVGVGKAKKVLPKCGVISVTKATTTWTIAEQFLRLNSSKTVILNRKLLREKSLWLFFSKSPIP